LGLLPHAQLVCPYREAERAAEIARLRYKEAKEQLARAEEARLAYAELAKEAELKNRAIQEAEARAAAIAKEGRGLQSTLAEKRDMHGQLVSELEEHTALVDQKARELAEAQALANQKAHMLHGVQVSSPHWQMIASLH
jgi:DNA repair exonuclease SbcCD ATPase subunit